MIAGRDSMFDIHLTNLVEKSSFDGILYRKMAFFISSFWFRIISFLFFLFGFIAKHVFRIKREDCSQIEDFEVVKGEQSDFQEEETPSLSFKFEYQISEVGSLSGSDEPAVVPSMVTNISKYCFLSENDFRGFVQEPDSMTFHIQESFVDPGDENSESKLSSEKDLEQLQKNFSTMGKNKFLAEEFSGFDSDSESSTSDGYSVKNLIIDSDSDGILSDIDCGGYECESDTTEVTMNSKSHKPPKFHTSDSSDEEYIECKVTALTEDVQISEGIEWSFDAEVTRVSGKYSCSPDKIPVNKSSNSDEESCHHMLKLKEMNGVAGSSEIPESEEAQLPSSIDMLLEFMDSSDDEALSFANKEDTSADIECEKENNAETVQKFETSHSKDSDSEEFDELETLWEHQDLIEQLKMELKKARGIGLPTIFEESESPKSVDDLKPWKIDEKFSREDPMDELRKFYKCYRERMRKFDILNYQKMYSIGFLQLKDALQSLGSQRPLIQTMTSILSQNLRPFRHRQCTNDSSKKFIKELQSDLETVYVGQTCLSWEFLRWQYEKADQLLHPANTYRTHQYNHVAEELQQFQVIVQRFLENEAFQGPRLPNYVKNRCVLRNLLQVPLIKEDCMKEKMEELKKGNNAITGEMLEEILEETINVLWDFIKSDKDETPVILRGLLRTQVELQDPSDFKIMVDAQAILLKKERKLKDILRTGNCLVKKFKKLREDRSNQDIFFSQVDLKLVSRVLKMPRITTDQLIWCHKKLHKITFSERKVQRETAFLLFPC
ncbi:hypothetical protein J5N97_006664 [Dioscorea zingiberensis]|uniref:Ribosomal protein L34Ae n=1 Tax=Dioscorea zingiberensis TaxID=325984 RepID=A0A9D5HTS2_9LILI|nr:hypothetical protein J5N97_006664 [Dioscorea zingiberensis]